MGILASLSDLIIGDSMINPNKALGRPGSKEEDAAAFGDEGRVIQTPKRPVWSSAENFPVPPGPAAGRDASL